MVREEGVHKYATGEAAIRTIWYHRGAQETRQSRPVKIACRGGVHGNSAFKRTATLKGRRRAFPSISYGVLLFHFEDFLRWSEPTVGRICKFGNDSVSQPHSLCKQLDARHKQSSTRRTKREVVLSKDHRLGVSRYQQRSCSPCHKGIARDIHHDRANGSRRGSSRLDMCVSDRRMERYVTNKHSCGSRVPMRGSDPPGGNPGCGSEYSPLPPVRGGA